MNTTPDNPTAANPSDDAARVRNLNDEAARLLAAKRPGEAIVKLTEAWELDPENIATAINLGGAYILQGKHAQAIPFLETAARLDPDNAMIRINLAAAYLGKLPFSSTEMQDKAIAAFEKALELNPRAPHVHYNLGLIYLQRDDLAQAAEQFCSALDDDPTDKDAQLWLGRIQSGDTDELAHLDD